MTPGLFRPTHEAEELLQVDVDGGPTVWAVYVQWLCGCYYATWSDEDDVDQLMSCPDHCG